MQDSQVGTINAKTIKFIAQNFKISRFIFDIT